MSVVLLCPYCGRLNTEPGPVEPGTVPATGDVSICWRCLQPAFVEGDHLRLPTAAEHAAIMGDPNVKAALAAAALFDRPSGAIAAARRVIEEGEP